MAGSHRLPVPPWIVSTEFAHETMKKNLITKRKHFSLSRKLRYHLMLFQKKISELGNGQVQTSQIDVSIMWKNKRGLEHIHKSRDWYYTGITRSILEKGGH